MKPTTIFTAIMTAGAVLMPAAAASAGPCADVFEGDNWVQAGYELSGTDGDCGGEPVYVGVRAPSYYSGPEGEGVALGVRVGGVGSITCLVSTDGGNPVQC